MTYNSSRLGENDGTQRRLAYYRWMLDHWNSEKTRVMHSRRTVLLVEDDPFIREIMLDVLQDEGFRAICAESTQGAIQTIEHDNDNIDAIFADIDLGDHGGGYEVARRARSVKPGVKVIYTSGGAREDFVNERVEDAVFVQKPYSPTDVCMLLKRTLDH